MSLCALMVCTSCGEKKFKIDGDIKGADQQSLVIEKASPSGQWIAVDSTRTNASGEFSVSVIAPIAPEIYRIKNGDNYFYFPIDSVENITIHANANGYTLEGSKNAEALSKFENMLAAVPENADKATLDKFKKQVFAEFIAPGKGSVVSYYVLTKTRNGVPLYNPIEHLDAKYYAAVATAFEQYNPNDPRTAMLKEITLQAMRQNPQFQTSQRVVHAQEIDFFDVSLPGVDGENKTLSQYVGKGKPVVLVFTVLTAQFAPEYNTALKTIADRATIFMVGYDADRYDWRRAAQNLPWINVFDEDGKHSQILVKYNVTTVPVAFIFNAAGELVDRADKPTEISAKI